MARRRKEQSNDFAMGALIGGALGVLASAVFGAREPLVIAGVDFSVIDLSRPFALAFDGESPRQAVARVMYTAREIERRFPTWTLTPNISVSHRVFRLEVNPTPSLEAAVLSRIAG